jgi:hypothetical protein
MELSTCAIGDRVCIGQIQVSFTEFTKLFPGLATINGPLCSGAVSGDVPIANAIFGRSFNPAIQASLASVGITDIFGNLNVQALSNFTGITNKFGGTFKYALSEKNGLDLKNALNLGNGASVFNGLVSANGGLNAPIINCEALNFTAKIFGADIDCASIKAGFGAFTSVAAPFKLFNIEHPSKPRHRLIHACLEGPEVGVYYRGHLSGANKIILPDYWENLIDVETITVHLTPHKFHQELYVKSIEWGKFVHIVNNNGGPIECDFIVYAERKDVEKLKIEVEDKA